MLGIAVPKGRLFTEITSLLVRAGLTPPDSVDTSRICSDGQCRWMVVRPFDVPVYVEQQVADVGIVGWDVLAERRSDVVELLDLEIGRCQFVVAAPEDGVRRTTGRLRVATKFPRVATTYFRERGVEADIIELKGATELAPAAGLADCIVDLMASGKTIRENKLMVTDVIGESTGRLIANNVSLRLRADVVTPIIEAIRKAAEEVRACG